MEGELIFRKSTDEEGEKLNYGVKIDFQVLYFERVLLDKLLSDQTGQNWPLRVKGEISKFQ